MPLLIHDVCIFNLVVFRNFKCYYDLWLLNNETAFKHLVLRNFYKNDQQDATV
jgi:hypothetical protein